MGGDRTGSCEERREAREDSVGMRSVAKVIM